MHSPLVRSLFDILVESKRENRDEGALRQAAPIFSPAKKCRKFNRWQE
jgi:hypothetical protein